MKKVKNQIRRQITISLSDVISGKHPYCCNKIDQILFEVSRIVPNEYKYILPAIKEYLYSNLKDI